MPKAAVYYNSTLAGVLTQEDNQSYRFNYDTAYMADSSLPAISVTLPKRKTEHHSTHLFSFFSGLLAEGINKDIQCRLLKIDENDDFTRLVKTADTDTIGAITVKEIPE